MSLLSGTKVLYLPLEQNMTDFGPYGFTFASANESYYNTLPQSVGGNYALGQKVSGYLVNTSAFYGVVGSQPNHLIEFDIYISGLEPQSTASDAHTLLEFKQGSTGLYFIQVKGYLPSLGYQPRLSVNGPGGFYATETDLPAYTGLYTRVGVLTSGTNRKIYLNGNMTEYNVTNVAIPSSFNRLHFLHDNSGIYIKNIKIWTGIGNYVYDVYSGNNLIITGSQLSMTNRTASLYAGATELNYPYTKTQNAMTFDVNSIYYRDRIDKVVLKNNNWVEAIYNFENGLNSGVLCII